MKTKIIVAILINVVFLNSSFALPKNVKPVPLAIREVTTMAFKRLIVDKNIHVILIADKGKNSITISGDENYLQTITVTSDKDILHISATKNLRSKKVTVYVPVKNLSYLELRSGAHVSSQGILSCSKLFVMVNSESVLELKNLGAVEIKSSDDCEFVYQKNEITKIEYIR